MNYIELFQNFPKELATFLTAMLPISELRGAIPVAIGVYKMSWFDAFLWSVLGNILPVFFLLWFWRSLAQILMKYSKTFNKFFNWLFKRTRRRFEGKYARFGSLALIIFVAIPLPMTGAWTGSVAAFIFGIPYWKAVGLIFLGVLIAGVVVTLATTGVIKVANF